MNTYLVTCNYPGSRLHKTLHLARAQSHTQAAQTALDSFRLATPLQLTVADPFCHSPKRETLLAFCPKDDTQEDVVQQYQRGCLESDVIILEVLNTEDHILNKN
jgi:hypothetical protein